MKECKVSIICNTYNQESYISEALDSFLMQKTDFEFEILVHDDASTDKTPSIILEYQKKYPDIIKPLFQKENQYSLNISVSCTHQYPRANGEYLALCEGDDYWIDEYKLQKQFDALEKNPDICICACRTIKKQNGKSKGYMAPANKKTIFTPEQVILGGGGFVGTNSIMFRKDSYLNNRLFGKLMWLDYFLQIICSIPNGMLYLDDCMSVYRVSAKGSWSVSMKNDCNRKIKHIDLVNDNLRILDSETDGVYHEAINRHILENEFMVLLLKGDYKSARSSKYKSIYTSLPVKKRLKISLDQFSHILRG